MTTGELMMDVGTVLDGEAAVEEGLIDHLGGLAEAIDCLYELIEQERSLRTRRGEHDPLHPYPWRRCSRKSVRNRRCFSSGIAVFFPV